MNAIEKAVAQLRAASTGLVVTEAELRASVPPPPEGTTDPVLLEAHAQKAALAWVRGKLVADVGFNRIFADKTEIAWLDKLLTVARLQELTKVRITKAGRSGGLRYDASDLAATFHGKKLLAGLGFGLRRTSLTKDEYAKLVEATARVGLTLPETIEPTTTEKFFAEKAEG